MTAEREEKLNRDIIYYEMELNREVDPARRLWLLQRIRDANIELLAIARADRQQIDEGNSNLQHALDLIAKRERERRGK